MSNAKRYRDRDGDTWEENGDGTLRLVNSIELRRAEGLNMWFDSAVDEYGPLVDEGTGARYGVFGTNEAEDEDEADEHAKPANTGQRAQALTVGVMLAKIVHGDEGHAANIAGTADTFARFILDVV